jgi:hypothetical protein
MGTLGTLSPKMAFDQAVQVSPKIMGTLGTLLAERTVPNPPSSLVGEGWGRWGMGTLVEGWGRWGHPWTSDD